jgi:hypothetical protein
LRKVPTGWETERKAYQEKLKNIMEGMPRDKQDAWLGEKLKACQETATCHKATKAQRGLNHIQE